MKSPRHPIDLITVHEAATVQNLTVFPLSLSKTGGPEYIPLYEAIMDHGLIVKEISESGSVPDLQVENPSNLNVLMLDGEELRGAKQNRILNTTVLLAARSKATIPVSCVESGRWHYTSTQFQAAKTVMSSKARRRKIRAVSQSLKSRQEYDSDQGEVWDEVAELNQKVGSHSPTGAMAAAYEKMRDELDEAIKQIPAIDAQCGLIAMINGKPTGIDLISRPEVYAKLHAQLLQSYAMEAIADLRSHKSNVSPHCKASTSRSQQPEPSDPLIAKSFLEQCAAIPGKAFASVGLGIDWRFNQDSIVGSGLQVEDSWVHMAYFLDEADAADESTTRRGRMVRASQRSRNRRV